MRKINIKKKILLLMIFPWMLSCGGNLFKQTAAKDSAEALLEDAKKSLDALDYTSAITTLLSMQSKYSDTFSQCQTSDGFRFCPREILAGAYAGRCGFNFLTFIDTISSSSGAVLNFLMQTFTTVTVNPSDCYAAQTVLETFSASEKTDDQKLFLALLGMAKMGVYLRNAADTDQDGVVDAGFDSCNSSKLSDADVKQVITGLGLFLTYSASLSVSGGATTDLSDINTVCQGLGLDCNITDPNSATLNAGFVDSFRDIIKSDKTNEYGIEDCDPLLPTCCP